MIVNGTIKETAAFFNVIECLECAFRLIVYMTTQENTTQLNSTTPSHHQLTCAFLSSHSLTLICFQHASFFIFFFFFFSFFSKFL